MSKRNGLHHHGPHKPLKTPKSCHAKSLAKPFLRKPHGPDRVQHAYNLSTSSMSTPYNPTYSQHINVPAGLAHTFHAPVSTPHYKSRRAFFYWLRKPSKPSNEEEHPTKSQKSKEVQLKEEQEAIYRISNELTSRRESANAELLEDYTQKLRIKDLKVQTLKNQLSSVLDDKRDIEREQVRVANRAAIDLKRSLGNAATGGKDGIDLIEIKKKVADLQRTQYEQQIITHSTNELNKKYDPLDHFRQFGIPAPISLIEQTKPHDSTNAALRELKDISAEYDRVLNPENAVLHAKQVEQRRRKELDPDYQDTDEELDDAFEKYLELDETVRGEIMLRQAQEALAVDVNNKNTDQASNIHANLPSQDAGETPSAYLNMALKQKREQIEMFESQQKQIESFFQKKKRRNIINLHDFDATKPSRLQLQFLFPHHFRGYDENNHPQLLDEDGFGDSSGIDDGEANDHKTYYDQYNPSQSANNFSKKQKKAKLQQQYYDSLADESKKQYYNLFFTKQPNIEIMATLSDCLMNIHEESDEKSKKGVKKQIINKNTQDTKIKVLLAMNKHLFSIQSSTPTLSHYITTKQSEFDRRHLVNNLSGNIDPIVLNKHRYHMDKLKKLHNVNIYTEDHHYILNNVANTALTSNNVRIIHLAISYYYNLLLNSNTNLYCDTSVTIKAPPGSVIYNKRARKWQLTSLSTLFQSGGVVGSQYDNVSISSDGKHITYKNVAQRTTMLENIDSNQITFIIDSIISMTLHLINVYHNKQIEVGDHALEKKKQQPNEDGDMDIWGVLFKDEIISDNTTSIFPKKSPISEAQREYDHDSELLKQSIDSINQYTDRAINKQAQMDGDGTNVISSLSYIIKRINANKGNAEYQNILRKKIMAKISVVRSKYHAIDEMNLQDDDPINQSDNYMAIERSMEQYMYTYYTFTYILRLLSMIGQCNNIFYNHIFFSSAPLSLLSNRSHGEGSTTSYLLPKIVSEIININTHIDMSFSNIETKIYESLNPNNPSNTAAALGHQRYYQDHIQAQYKSLIDNYHKVHDLYQQSPSLRMHLVHTLYVLTQQTANSIEFTRNNGDSNELNDSPNDIITSSLVSMDLPSIFYASNIHHRLYKILMQSFIDYADLSAYITTSKQNFSIYEHNKFNTIQDNYVQQIMLSVASLYNIIKWLDKYELLTSQTTAISTLIHFKDIPKIINVIQYKLISANVNFDHSLLYLQYLLSISTVNNNHNVSSLYLDHHNDISFAVSNGADDNSDDSKNPALLRQNGILHIFNNFDSSLTPMQRKQMSSFSDILKQRKNLNYIYKKPVGMIDIPNLLNNTKILHISHSDDSEDVAFAPTQTAPGTNGISPLTSTSSKYISDQQYTDSLLELIYHITMNTFRNATLSYYERYRMLNAYTMKRTPNLLDNNNSHISLFYPNNDRSNIGLVSTLNTKYFKRVLLSICTDIDDILASILKRSANSHYWQQQNSSDAKLVRRSLEHQYRALYDVFKVHFNDHQNGANTKQIKTSQQFHAIVDELSYVYNIEYIKQFNIHVLYYDYYLQQQNASKGEKKKLKASTNHLSFDSKLDEQPEKVHIDAKNPVMLKNLLDSTLLHTFKLTNIHDLLYFLLSTYNYGVKSKYLQTINDIATNSPLKGGKKSILLNDTTLLYPSPLTVHESQLAKTAVSADASDADMSFASNNSSFIPFNSELYHYTAYLHKMNNIIPSKYHISANAGNVNVINNFLLNDNFTLFGSLFKLSQLEYGTVVWNETVSMLPSLLGTIQQLLKYQVSHSLDQQQIKLAHNEQTAPLAQQFFNHRKLHQFIHKYKQTLISGAINQTTNDTQRIPRKGLDGRDILEFEDLHNLDLDPIIEFQQFFFGSGHYYVHNNDNTDFDLDQSPLMRKEENVAIESTSPKNKKTKSDLKIDSDAEDSDENGDVEDNNDGDYIHKSQSNRHHTPAVDHDNIEFIQYKQYLKNDYSALVTHINPQFIPYIPKVDQKQKFFVDTQPTPITTFLYNITTKLDLLFQQCLQYTALCNKNRATWSDIFDLDPLALDFSQDVVNDIYNDQKWIYNILTEVNGGVSDDNNQFKMGKNDIKNILMSILCQSYDSILINKLYFCIDGLSITSKKFQNNTKSAKPHKSIVDLLLESTEMQLFYQLIQTEDDFGNVPILPADDGSIPFEASMEYMYLTQTRELLLRLKSFSIQKALSSKPNAISVTNQSALIDPVSADIPPIFQRYFYEHQFIVPLLYEIWDETEESPSRAKRHYASLDDDDDMEDYYKDLKGNKNTKMRDYYYDNDNEIVIFSDDDESEYNYQTSSGDDDEIDQDRLVVRNEKRAKRSERIELRQYIMERIERKRYNKTKRSFRDNVSNNMKLDQDYRVKMAERRFVNEYQDDAPKTSEFSKQRQYHDDNNQDDELTLTTQYNKHDKYLLTNYGVFIENPYYVPIISYKMYQQQLYLNKQRVALYKENNMANNDQNVILDPNDPNYGKKMLNIYNADQSHEILDNIPLNDTPNTDNNKATRFNKDAALDETGRNHFISNNTINLDTLNYVYSSINQQQFYHLSQYDTLLPIQNRSRDGPDDLNDDDDDEGENLDALLFSNDGSRANKQLNKDDELKKNTDNLDLKDMINVGILIPPPALLINNTMNITEQLDEELRKGGGDTEKKKVVNHFLDTYEFLQYLSNESLIKQRADEYNITNDNDLDVITTSDNTSGTGANEEHNINKQLQRLPIIIDKYDDDYDITHDIPQICSFDVVDELYTAMRWDFPYSGANLIEMQSTDTSFFDSSKPETTYNNDPNNEAYEAKQKLEQQSYQSVLSTPSILPTLKAVNIPYNPNPSEHLEPPTFSQDTPQPPPPQASFSPQISTTIPTKTVEPIISQSYDGISAMYASNPLEKYNIPESLRHQSPSGPTTTIIIPPSTLKSNTSLAAAVAVPIPISEATTSQQLIFPEEAVNYTIFPDFVKPVAIEPVMDTSSIKPVGDSSSQFISLPEPIEPMAHCLSKLTESTSRPTQNTALTKTLDENDLVNVTNFLKMMKSNSSKSAQSQSAPSLQPTDIQTSRPTPLLSDFDKLSSPIDPFEMKEVSGSKKLSLMAPLPQRKGKKDKEIKM